MLNLRAYRRRPGIANYSLLLRRGPRLNAAASAVVTYSIGSLVRDIVVVNVVNHREHPHSLPSDCTPPGRYSNKRHSIHGPYIHSRNRYRRNSRCADPSSRDANGRRRYRNPTRAASTTRPHKELRSTHREPSNSPSSRNPSSPGSKGNRPREREAGCNRAAVVVVLMLPRAARKKRFDRKARSGRIAVSCTAVHCKNHRQGVRSSDRTPVLARAATAAAGTRIDPPKPDYRWPDHRYSLAEADSVPTALAFYCKHLAQ